MLIIKEAGFRQFLPILLRLHGIYNLPEEYQVQYIESVARIVEANLAPPLVDHLPDEALLGEIVNEKPEG